MPNPITPLITARGQSLPEYAIILSLVGVSLITAFSMLGQTSSGAMNDMSARISSVNAKSLVSAGQSYDVSALVGQPEVINNSVGTLSPPVTGGATTTLNPADFAVATSTIANSIDTTGANGSTELLLASLESNIPALLASNKITQAQANDLSQLANLGHQIAAVEKLVEGGVANSNQSLATLEANTFVLNNQNYDLSTLLNEIQLVTETGGTARVPQDSDTLVGQFYALRASILTNIADPEAQSYVGALAQNIMAIGDTMENVMRDVQRGVTPIPDDFNAYMAGSVVYDAQLLNIPSVGNTDVSTVTNVSSSNICTAQGTGTDTGTHCTP